MKNFKIALLAAVAVSGLASGNAFAQVAVNDGMSGAELRGAGASSVESVLVQAFNCVSGADNAQQLGRGGALTLATPVAPSLTTVAPGTFTSAPTTTRFNVACETTPTATTAPYNFLFTNFRARYVSTGSGFGREIWRNFSNRFASGTAGASNGNPFETADAASRWTNVQFAFSDSPISQSDLDAYNTNANSATNRAGAGIQIPLYVLPVALAYSAQYGTSPTGVPLNFVAPVGGLRMNQAQYCGIFNGTVTNFNQLYPATTGTASVRSPADTAARWTADGVPIRLIGRLDNSGTTDIFTRHLTAVCGTTGNRYTGASQQLPTAAVASGVTWSGTVRTGAEVPGRFSRATGSSGVADVVALAPDVPTASGDGTLLNGKFTYISSDFVAPVAGAVLQAAQLTQIGSTATYRRPNATDGASAFATILPPQSLASGAYNANDPRRNSVTGALVSRGNPLDWADVLYSRADVNGGFTARTLAAPPAGYPITGTTFLLTSTCFANPANRLAMNAFLATVVRKSTRNGVWVSGAANVSTSLLSGTAATANRGLTAQNGLAPISPAWQRAIYDTFLVNTTTGGLGARNLWIQNRQPTTNSLTTPVATTGNPGCTANTGA